MIRFIGANPGITIFDGDERIAFAGVWRADWSERGAGRAIVLWHQGKTRVVASDATLGLWLAQDFTRHFPEVAGLPWPDPEAETTEIALSWDLTHGVTAEGGGIRIELGPPTDRRLFQTDDFDLGGARHHLTTVYMPCVKGFLNLHGVRVEGSSKAFIADAEVWSSIASGPEQPALGERADLGDVEVGQVMADGGDEDAA